MASNQTHSLSSFPRRRREGRSKRRQRTSRLEIKKTWKKNFFYIFFIRCGKESSAAGIWNGRRLSFKSVQLWLRWGGVELWSGILCVKNEEKIKIFCFVRPYSLYLEIKKSRTVNLDAYIFFILWKYLV